MEWNYAFFIILPRLCLPKTWFCPAFLISNVLFVLDEDCTHLGLEMGTPEGRIRSEASGRVLSQERLGGPHHRYHQAA
jgi:hypothetical protein